MMKLFFIVGFVLCGSTFIYGVDPDLAGPHTRERLDQAEYDEEVYLKVEDGIIKDVYTKVEDGIIQQRPFHPININIEPENQLPQTPNNFYLYMIQNFFFGKPVNQITANDEPQIVEVECSKNEDCKKPGHYCSNGVCKLKPHPHHLPQQCSVDRDCESNIPTGFLFLIPIYCEKGQCKRGIRKPEITEPQACNHTTDCLNGGICINHLCQPFVPPTLAPLPPLHHDSGLEKCRENADCKKRNHHCNNGVCMLKPHHHLPQQCNVDRDCESGVPSGFLFLFPIYCENGQCKRGLRIPEITEPQACNHTTDCPNGSVCIDQLCQPFVPPTLAPLPPLHEKCRENADCKERNHHCNNGFCKPLYHQPPSCKVDSDCEISVPTGILFLIPIYCDNGQCKRGLRIPEITEPQACNHTTDCLNGGICINHLCQPFVPPTLAPLPPLHHDNGLEKCHENADCKERNHHCNNGVCMLKPHHHLPQQCNVDRDCESGVPSGFLFLFPIYCEKGQCKRGIRKPEITEPQACNHTTDCLNGGICINHLCQPFVPPTLAPLPPLHEKCRENADCKERNHHCSNGFCKPLYHQPPSCKVDSDCEISVPTGILFLIPIYCDNGQCKRGLRIPEITEPQACNHTTDCLNGGICINHLCQPFVPPTLAPLPPLPHENDFEKCRENADCKEQNHHCNNGFCKPLYHQPPSCKVDSDCEISVPTGILLLIPVFCDNGKCNMGLRKDGTVTRKPKSPELQICNQDSDCVNGGVCRHRRCKLYHTGLLLPCKADHNCPNSQYCEDRHCRHGIRKPKRQTCHNDSDCRNFTTSICIDHHCTMIHPPSSFQCKTYHDCIGFHGPLPKGSVSVRYECNKGQCSVSGNIEENCTSHIDCPFPQYCQNGKCHPWIFEPLHKPKTTQKPPECKEDSDCYQSGVVCGGGRYCKNGECHTRHFSIPLPILLAETRKPCKDDSGCYGHSILCGIPHHCESSYCVTSQFPAVPVTPEIHSDTTLSPLTVLPHTKKECKKNHDCARYGRHPFYFPQYYCDHGICKRGIRPAIATQNPHEPVTEDVLPQTTATHSKHCKEDFECNPLQKMYLPFALRQYCDNGICKHGVRPAIATPMTNELVTAIVIPTKKYPKHPKHCKKDHDCRDKSKMLTYCDNGECKHGRRPKISTIPPTQQQPTTEIIVPQTPASGAQACKKDRDCVKLIGFQHKALVSVYCHEGHCALKPQENDATTTLALESSTIVINTVTKKLHHCKTTPDCVKFTPKGLESLCIKHHCILIGSNGSEVNKPASVEPPLSLVTVKPLESHSTHKPAKTCKHDTDCHNPKHHTKEHYFQKQCIKGKCVLAPRHPKNTTTHGHGHTIKPHVHHIPTTKAPHTHHVTEKVEDLVLRTTESHDIGPEIPASTTPHVYTCRRNRDCADYPHPKDMPVYCEHRLCKHGHRRPKNDYDSCKSHQDCSEGPCVEGFCTKPNHHHH